MANREKFGKYYECVMEQAKGKPKMSRAELHERLKGVHTLQGYWDRLEAEKAEKRAK